MCKQDVHTFVHIHKEYTYSIDASTQVQQCPKQTARWLICSRRDDALHNHNQPWKESEQNHVLITATWLTVKAERAPCTRAPPRRLRLKLQKHRHLSRTFHNSVLRLKVQHQANKGRLGPVFRIKHHRKRKHVQAQCDSTPAAPSLIWGA